MKLLIILALLLVVCCWGIVAWATLKMRANFKQIDAVNKEIERLRRKL